MSGTPDEGTLAPGQALRDLASLVLGDNSFEAVLQRATVVAKGSIAGADDVSVTMTTRDNSPTTVASSGRLAEAVDERQYAAGHGPCLDAMATGQTHLVSDLRQESRWPDYVPHAIEAGGASSLSVPLIVDGVSVGAFNAYSRKPHTFDEERVQQMTEDLAAYAGIVLNNAGLYFTATTRAEQMADAMRSRSVIEQAKGILMAGRRCSADEAFDILVRLSQQSHRKLREVAEALVHEA